MYIKKVIIEGFRSYKERSEIKFDQKHNVIVGKNGSGKSNVFKALEFILNHQYRSISSKEWQKWVYEGSETKVLATVEVHFDNSNGTLPVETDEVQIKRIFGSKKDQWSMNGKNTTKEDVTSILESAGLSRTNPYYIVAQGQVTQLIKMKDEERLQLVKDIAGTRVYDDRRKESMKIMAESERKRAQIRDIMDYFNSRLAELEEEQEELREYQNVDRKIRAIQLTLYRTALQSAEKEKAKIEKDQSQTVDVDEVYEQLNEKREAKEENQKNLHKVELDSGVKEKEINRLVKERRKQNKSRKKLDLARQAAEEKLQDAGSRRKEIEGELEELTQKIETTEKLLNEKSPEFEKMLRTEEHLANQLTDAESRQTDLYSKQNRSSLYKNKEDRDAQLKTLIAEQAKSLKQSETENAQYKQQIETCQQQLEAHSKLIAEQEGKVKSIEETILEGKDRLAEFNTTKESKMKARKSTQKEIAGLKTKQKHTKEEMQSAKQKFRNTMSRGMWGSYESVKRLVAKHKIEGVYGPLIELFSVDSNFEKCVETVAGGKLLNWVVEDDTVASRLIELLQREKGGRVTFMPLQRLNFREKKAPNTNSAFRMVDKLEYEPRVKKAIMQVFGNWLICRDMQTAKEMSQQYNMDTTTLDGDIMDSRGAIKGGFIDSRKIARISSMRRINDLQQKLDQIIAQVKSSKKKLSGQNQELSKLLGEIQKSEGTRSTLRDSRQEAQDNVKSEISKSKIVKSRLKSSDVQLRKRETEIQRLAQKIGKLKEELSAEFKTDLTDKEMQEIEQLTNEVQNLQEQLKKASEVKIQAEAQVQDLENELVENLLKQKEDLERELADSTNEELKESVQKCNGDLQNARTLESELNEKISGLEKAVDIAVKRMNQLTLKVKDLSREIGKLEKRLTRANQDTQKKFKKVKRLEETILQENEKIRKLGTLPDEEIIEQYQDMSRKKLEKHLSKQAKELENFANVNKKALDQYEHFTQQRDQLLKRQRDQEKSKKAIQELIAHLDAQKDNAIQRTYKAIASNFSKVFSELVEGGTGKFVLNKRNVPDENMDEDEEDDEKVAEEKQKESQSDSYVGVGVRVSFTGGRDDLYSMTQLSGGQQTVVALSLIFAIQRCDPSPFYLFDEIDAALDAVHRQSVAHMISTHADASQFITTTFRPEMLQYAQKFVGVYYRNKISVPETITRMEAANIIQEDQQEIAEDQNMEETEV